MTTADHDIVITSIQYPTGTSLQDYIAEEGVTTSGPEAEIPTGLDIARNLLQQQNVASESQFPITNAQV